MVSNYGEDFRLELRLCVSIRYIAVLGFQHSKLGEVNTNDPVSIRYIAVLGFQRCETIERTAERAIVSIRYIAVLGFQPLPQKRPL